jgi:hypothetical protein
VHPVSAHVVIAGIWNMVSEMSVGRTCMLALLHCLLLGYHQQSSADRADQVLRLCEPCPCRSTSQWTCNRRICRIYADTLFCVVLFCGAAGTSSMSMAQVLLAGCCVRPAPCSSQHQAASSSCCCSSTSQSRSRCVHRCPDTISSAGVVFGCHAGRQAGRQAGSRRGRQTIRHSLHAIQQSCSMDCCTGTAHCNHTFVVRWTLKQFVALPPCPAEV